VKDLSRAAVLAASLAALVSACAPDKPPAEALRAVRTAEIRYDKARETNRYVGTVQSRHEVNEAFRVGGKVLQRKVDVGQKVREGDVLALLDDTDYRQAEEAARQHHVATVAQARQAESDRKRLDALKIDGSVSVSDDEKAQTGHETASATAEAAARQLELARNRLKYTVLRASRSGVVTAVRAEAGQVVAEGAPIVSIANEGEPEIVADVPEDHLAVFKASRYKAFLQSAPEQAFDVVLRELSPQAALGRAQSLYNRGQTDLLPLLDAQRSRHIVQVSANDSSTQLLLDSVQLYKALGGGWQAFEPNAKPKEPS